MGWAGRASVVKVDRQAHLTNGWWQAKPCQNGRTKLGARGYNEIEGKPQVSERQVS